MESKMEFCPYPKITNKLRDVRYALQKHGLIIENETPAARSSEETEYTPSKLPITGTVKLHGTHADIRITPKTNKITYQSRNRVSTPDFDSYGFATAMSAHEPAISRLKDRYYTQFAELNPDVEIEDDDKPLILAGEYIGQKIQNNVAINNLTPRFVIVSCSINGSWLPDTDYADLCDEEAGVWNISRAGFFHGILDVNDSEASLRELMVVTNAVERKCPFAGSFGIDGPGEGVVWKFDRFPNLPETWFKVKADSMLPTTKAPQDPVQAALLLKEKGEAGALAARAVTEVRLQQGVEYLREMDVPLEKKSVGRFVEWIWKDAMAEERAEIEEGGMDGKRLRSAIMGIAKPWFFNRVETEAWD